MCGSCTREAPPDVGYCFPHLLAMAHRAGLAYDIVRRGSPSQGKAWRIETTLDVLARNHDRHAVKRVGCPHCTVGR